jgi:hypothetical protein
MSIDAAKITGTVTSNQVLSIRANQVIGTFEASQIPTLDTSKVSGVFSSNQLPALNMISGRITSSQLPIDFSSGGGGGSSGFWLSSTANTTYTSCNVGIGTTAPSSTLHVVGDINYTGNLLKNGLPAIGPYAIFNYSGSWFSPTYSNLPWAANSTLGSTRIGFSNNNPSVLMIPDPGVYMFTITLQLTNNSTGQLFVGVLGNVGTNWPNSKKQQNSIMNTVANQTYVSTFVLNASTLSNQNFFQTFMQNGTGVNIGVNGSSTSAEYSRLVIQKIA